MRTYLIATALFAPSLLVAQATPADLARERAERVHWLASDPLSPARAVAIEQIPPVGVTLGGSGSDIPLEGLPAGRIVEANGALTLKGWGADLALPVGRTTSARGVRFQPSGTAGRFTVLVSRDDKTGVRPAFFPYHAAARFVVTLTPTTPRTARILLPVGTTVEATEVGTVAFTLADTTRTLHVMRVAGDGEESELLINFRDGTTGQGTYPAGRFVELIPTAGGKYLLDFNRAYNPNCAYSSVFPCPIPWAGNSVAAKIEAGEKYPPEHLGR
ncbi:MAG TPA: DUF1684 domain-containing protein [Gemmatimonadales bacterium]|nr:DUF1684 domain-containing protein [Gemmatimonadales bacterium]